MPKTTFLNTFHLAVPTEDLEKTIRFYETLGFVMVNRESETVAFLQNGAVMIETYVVEDTAKCHGALDHFCLDVLDVNAAYDEMKALGYEIETEMSELPFWGNGIRFFKIYGPSREVIEFSQRMSAERQ